ncbi:MAG: AAA family ATPase, partial [bacterium]
SVYGALVQNKQNIEEQIKNVDSTHKTIEDLKKQAKESLKAITEIRKKITTRRTEFLKSLLIDNTYVSINVTPYGNIESVESGFRKIINREYGGLENDIGHPSQKNTLLGNLYNNYPVDEVLTEKQINTFENSLEEFKRNLIDLYKEGKNTGFGGWFTKHIQSLPPEQLDRLDFWFPEDSLQVLYSVEKSSRKMPVKQGSPGQKTAALLAFLLTYGTEPLILDQPEDDLDNHLIYDLIVTQLKEIKTGRQIIVVTHNANIVVNGDSENVIALDIQNGQTHAVCAGCLQEQSVRKEICKVMEGGLKAFDLRYKRIREGSINV